MQTVTLKFYYQEEHMTDRYQSPLSERYASKEMQYMETLMDRSGRVRAGTGTADHG